MSRQSIKALIDANIKRNGQREITGQILNSVLNAMNDGYSPVVDSFVLDGNTITVLKNLDLEGINQSVDSSKMVDTDGKTFAEKFAQGGGETGCKNLIYNMVTMESGEIVVTESESQKALNIPVYQGILDKTISHVHIFLTESSEGEGEINAIELLSSQIVSGDRSSITAGTVLGTSGIGMLINIENLALSDGAVFTFALQQALTEQQLLNIGRIPSKTEKVRIDIVQYEDTYLFKKGNVALNFAELNNMLQNTPDFLIFVHGNREHRCVFIDTTSSQKVMRFVAPIVNDGVLKTQSFSVFSNDGVVITAVTKTDINCENSSNKVQSIIGAGTASAYPSTKAIVEYAAKKEELNELVSEVYQIESDLGDRIDAKAEQSELDALSLKVGKFEVKTATELPATGIPEDNTIYNLGTQRFVIINGIPTTNELGAVINFHSGTTATQLVYPESSKWNIDADPSIDAGADYQLTILDGVFAIAKISTLTQE